MLVFINTLQYKNNIDAIKQSVYKHRHKKKKN